MCVFPDIVMDLLFCVCGIRFRSVFDCAFDADFAYCL